MQLLAQPLTPMAVARSCISICLKTVLLQGVANTNATTRNSLRHASARNHYPQWQLQGIELTQLKSTTT